MDALNLILTRRSTRQFLDKPIEKDKLDKIIMAGRHAPSGGNNQSCHFIVIENKKILDELVIITRDEFKQMEIEDGMYKSLISSITQSKKGNYIFHYNAPVLIVVANKKDYGNAMADSACAIENMMLMANALDLGSCWINQLTWLNDKPNIVKYLKELGLNNDENICGSLVIGYPNTKDGLPIRSILKRTGNIVTFIK